MAMSMQSKLGVILAVLVLIAAVLIGTVILMGRPDVVIGSKNFTESKILCEMLALLVDDRTERSVGTKTWMPTLVCFNALDANDLDAYPEYTGTGLVTILKEPALTDPNAVYRKVSQAFAETYDLVWLDPLGFNNTYTITMRAEQAKELGIETVSDLAEHLRSGAEPELRAGFNAEFLQREDGYPGVKEAYGLAFPSEPKLLESGVMYKACADKDVDVICGFATDGRIPAFDLITLADDKRFFPPYYAAPLVRQTTLDRYPELREVLNLLAGRISDDEMRQMNYEVDENGREAVDVAREFLVREGLLPAE